MLSPLKKYEYYRTDLGVLYCGDCMEILKKMPDNSIHCCVTSPPYWGLRDYGCDGQLGLEKTPEEYTEKMVLVFREVRRVLRDDGTLWLNLGSSYAATTKGSSGVGKNGSNKGTLIIDRRWQVPPGFKPKDLIGIPWLVAFALQADGWYLRQDIIWSKPNPMPESVRDRCTKAHEYVFLLSKSSRYYYDAEAVKEESVYPDDNRKERQKPEDYAAMMGDSGQLRAVINPSNARTYPYRNRRSVWTIATQPCKEAHFATFPTKLIEPCILAGCPKNGTVLDPFFGAGTSGLVCEDLGRRWAGAELNEGYCAIAKQRIKAEADQGNLFHQPQPIERPEQESLF